MAATASPQLVAVGEQNQFRMLHKNNTYANQIKQTAISPLNSINLKPISFLHGEPSVTFDSTDIEAYIQEENLQYALILKFSNGYPDIHELRKLFPQQFQIKGECNIGLLHHRHFLVRFSLVEDFVNIYSRNVESVIIKENGIGQKYTFRIQRWTTKFNHKEETPIALAWISFPGLPCQMFARQAIYSLASAVGKPLHVDKATADKTRPSTARVKVEVNLLSKLPDRVRMCFKDVITGDISVEWQTIKYDRLPKYCTTCKKQGHGDEDCHANNQNLQQLDDSLNDQGQVKKFQGDLRQKLNDQRKTNIDVAGKDEKGNGMIAGTTPVFTKARKSPAAKELTTKGQLVFSDDLGEKRDAQEVFGQDGTNVNHVSTMKDQLSLIQTTNKFQVLLKDTEEDDDDEVTACQDANAVTIDNSDNSDNEVTASLLPHAREKVIDNSDKHSTERANQGINFRNEGKVNQNELESLENIEVQVVSGYKEAQIMRAHAVNVNNSMRAHAVQEGAGNVIFSRDDDIIIQKGDDGSNTRGPCNLSSPTKATAVTVTKTNSTQEIVETRNNTQSCPHGPTNSEIETGRSATPKAKESRDHRILAKQIHSNMANELPIDDALKHGQSGPSWVGNEVNSDGVECVLENQHITITKDKFLNKGAGTTKEWVNKSSSKKTRVQQTSRLEANELTLDGGVGACIENKTAITVPSQSDKLELEAEMSVNDRTCIKQSDEHDPQSSYTSVYSPSHGSYVLIPTQELELLIKLERLMKLHGTNQVTLEITKKLTKQEHQIYLQMLRNSGYLCTSGATGTEEQATPPKERPPQQPKRVQPARSSKSNSTRGK